MSSRKLQQEFDKLQKKVAEGLQQFDEIHDKIAATDNPSLKDKLEGDLRKEIKKLQRSRDQVKQWSGDLSNKLDRSALQESRSRIENAMERFKEVEKISKLKQFSNEGLEMQTKLGARGLDEAKKNEAVRYITESLDELNHQSELLVAESTQLLHKKKSPATQASMDDLAMKMERNNAHVSKLELILRNLDNDQLAPERIDDIKDDLDYYLENNQLPDFVDYDDFYDSLELDESLEIVPYADDHIPAPKNPKAPELKAKESEPKPAKESDPKSLKEPEPKPAKQSDPKSLKEPELRPAKELERKDNGKSLRDDTRDKTSLKDTPRSKPAVSLHATTPPSNSWTNSQPLQASRGNSAPSSSSASSSAAPTAAPILSSAPTSSRVPPPGLNPYSKPGTPVPNSLAHATPVSRSAGSKTTVAEELKKKALLHAASHEADKHQSGDGALSHNGVAQSADMRPSSPSVKLLDKTQSSSSLRKQSLASPDLGPVKKGPMSATAALASSRLNQPLPFSEIALQLEASLVNCPDSFDLEKPRQYNPINVHPSSVDYPQEPMYELNSISIMRKFDTDTLFFCFYYNEGVDNLAKYNAAKELSRRGWVFNVETKQWFSKEEKVKRRSVFNLDNSAAEAEKGSYKYFDYESSWLVRRKDNFEFRPELKRTF